MDSLGWVRWNPRAHETTRGGKSAYLDGHIKGSKKKVKISCQFGLPSSLLLVSTRALKRGHPDPCFIQNVPRVSIRAWDEG